MKNRQYSLFMRMMRGAHKTPYGPYPRINHPDSKGLGDFVSTAQEVVTFSIKRRGFNVAKKSLLIPKHVFRREEKIKNDIAGIVGHRKVMAKIHLYNYLPLPSDGNKYETSKYPEKQ